MQCAPGTRDTALTADPPEWGHSVRRGSVAPGLRNKRSSETSDEDAEPGEH